MFIVNMQLVSDTDTVHSIVMPYMLTMLTSLI